MRWARWLLSHIARLHDVIIVNLDETRLDNQSQWKHGYHVRRKCHLGVGSEFVPCPARESRRSMLAAVCSKGDLQRLLPQVFLHKEGNTGAHAPSHHAPQQEQETEWSNKTGTIDSRVLRRWVYTLRAKINAYASNLWVILVLDCCPVHISRQFLQYCCRLGILLLILPARCTWFIQPLDVYVFGPLKRRLASALAARRANGHLNIEEGVVPWQTQQHDEAKSFLQCVDGLRCLERCGLHLDIHMWREPLRSMVVGCDLKARLPTTDELAVLLGRSAKQAACMHPLLLSWPQKLQAASVPMHPPKAFLPISRRRLPDRSHSQGHAAAGSAPKSNTNIVVLSAAARLWPPATRRARPPTPDRATGPAAGTRQQTAARESSQGV